MTVQELKGAITDWWEFNQGQAQMPEGRYFTEQAIGTSKHGKEFEILSAKDVSEGISVKVKSGSVEVSGILYTKTGEFVQRGTNTQYQVSGASIG
jgi:hypothetical protein